jgi:hypothetical protein
MSAWRSNRWADFPDYIVGITAEIWEGRDFASLARTYAEDIPVRTPMGVSRGNQGVIAATMGVLHEFPDRELLTEDVIWSEDGTGHRLSSHRILSRGTHLGEGAFGPPTGRAWTARALADCAARGEVIDDEWLVRDVGGICRQLGVEPRDMAARLLAAPVAPRSYRPEEDVEGPYRGRGNDDEWGRRYEETLGRIMAWDLGVIQREWDRAVVGAYAGGQVAVGQAEATRAWLGLRASFPNAVFEVHHRIGMPGGLMPPRAALRWSLDGLHEGTGSFGPPTGARVHVMGISHAEFGPFGPRGTRDGPGLRREWALWDEVAIWAQILEHVGAHAGGEEPPLPERGAA